MTEENGLIRLLKEQDEPMPVKVELTVPPAVWTVVNEQYGMTADPLMFVPMDGVSDGYTDLLFLDSDGERVLKVTVHPDESVTSFWIGDPR